MPLPSVPVFEEAMPGPKRRHDLSGDAKHASAVGLPEGTTVFLDAAATAASARAKASLIRIPVGSERDPLPAAARNARPWIAVTLKVIKRLEVTPPPLVRVARLLAPGLAAGPIAPATLCCGD